MHRHARTCFEFCKSAIQKNPHSLNSAERISTPNDFWQFRFGTKTNRTPQVQTLKRPRFYLLHMRIKNNTTIDPIRKIPYKNSNDVCQSRKKIKLSHVKKFVTNKSSEHSAENGVSNRLKFSHRFPISNIYFLNIL